MGEERFTIELSLVELRAVTGYAVACAEPALVIFERDCPNDSRPRQALEEARRFAAGGNRTQALRVTALAAHRAGGEVRDMQCLAAAAAAKAAGHAAASAYLHPLAKSHQVMHILGAAVYTARAIELDAGDDGTAAARYLETATDLASPIVLSVLSRYPRTTSTGGRPVVLLGELEASLRGSPTNP